MEGPSADGGPSAPEVLGDLFERERRDAHPAVRVDGARTVEYTYHDFVTTAWKTANFLSHRGIHEASTVAVVDDPAVPPVLVFLGAAQLGALTRFDPPESIAADLLVGPGESVQTYDLPTGATRLAYTTGENVADPTIESFGRSVPSENPTEPPETVDSRAPALWTADGALAHSDLLARAESAATSLSPVDDVVVRAPLAAVGTVVAGVLAPLLAGATVVFPGEGTVGDVAVAEAGREPPEARIVAVGD